jgi:hypothetical protein
VITTNESYRWSFVTQVFIVLSILRFMASDNPFRTFKTVFFRNGQPSHGGDRKTFEILH